MKPSFFLIFLVAAFYSVGPGTIVGQTLEITPNRVLLDETAVIRSTGLDPNEHVTIRAELVDGENKTWASEAEFVADAQGVVDVSKQAPLKGSYKEVSAMGLVWSMMPAEKHVSSYQSPHDLAPQVIKFSLIQSGQQSQANLEQRALADGVRQIKLSGQLHGVLFLPGGTGRHPGVLVLGGSEGGVPLRKAAWLASHGYAALALAYFHYEDLSPKLEAIPLEYFGRALGWMIDQPNITPDEIAVMGTSRGGELALELGSIYPQIRAIVAYVPANVRFPACCGDTKYPYAWTLGGKPLAYLPLRAIGDFSATMNATIRVEHTRGPILLISGEDDGVWHSTKMADEAVSRLKESHFTFPVEHLKYANAGHRAGRAEIVPTWHGIVKQPISGQEMNLGGSAKGDALSSLDAIPKVLEFLRRNLPDHASPQ